MKHSTLRLQAQRSGAFTLVELLVVIGIIGALIAILLPTLAGARRQAQLAQCGSNLRQLAMGCLLRAQDSGGYVPIAGEIVIPYNTSGPNGMASALNDSLRKKYTYARAPGVMGGDLPVPLPAAIAPYLGWKNLPYNNWDQLDQALNDNTNIWKMFMCPSTGSYAYNRKAPNSNDTTPFNQGTMLAVKRGTQFSKASVAWSTNTDYGINEGVFGYHFNPAYNDRRLRGQLTKIRNTSSTMLFSDAQRRARAAYQFMPDGWICWSPDQIAGENKPVPLGEAFKKPGAGGRAKDPGMFDKARHRNRMNIVFADGHVENVPIEQGALDRVLLSSN